MSVPHWLFDGLLRYHEILLLILIYVCGVYRGLLRRTGRKDRDNLLRIYILNT